MPEHFSDVSHVFLSDNSNSLVTTGCFYKKLPTAPLTMQIFVLKPNQTSTMFCTQNCIVPHD